MVEMNAAERKAYEWTKGQNYPSVAAQHARTLADLVDRLTAKLAIYEPLVKVSEGDEGS